MTAPRLLIVDDEEAQLKALAFTLEDSGYSVLGFTDPRRALDALRSERFDLLLTDLRMPGMDGIAMLNAALECDGDLVVLVMTGHGSIDTAVEAMKAGALDYILKPFKLGAMRPILERALGVRRLRIENARLLRHLNARTVELEAANKELEAFSYSVSHDLRAPLRHVNGFAEILLREYSDAVPPEARRHLETIAGGARRMNQLIDDLLRLSRLGRQSLTFGPVDMRAMAGGILEELRRESPERAVEVELGELPDCVGDPALLRQVWINLLSNAFKFTRKRDPARIRIDCTREGEGDVYRVRDNGAGFEMAYAGKLFGVFQRLHRAEEFEGTGVGLSIVQRILHRHGGRIWAQSAPNEGATFCFVVPEPQPGEGGAAAP
jgi:signal transduction histidine kinase